MIRNYIVFKKLKTLTWLWLRFKLNLKKGRKVNIIERCYDLKNMKEITKLKFLFKNSIHIDFEKSKKHIEDVHNLKNYLNLELESVSNKYLELPLEKLITKFKNQDYDYSQYLKIDNKLNYSSINTSELIEIEEDDHSYFSKPFLLSLKDMYKNNDKEIYVILTKIKFKIKKKSTIKIDIFLDQKTKVILNSYDISYNPPNGNASFLSH